MMGGNLTRTSSGAENVDLLYLMKMVECLWPTHANPDLPFATQQIGLETVAQTSYAFRGISMLAVRSYYSIVQSRSVCQQF